MEIKDIPEEIIGERIKLARYNINQAEERFDKMKKDYTHLSQYISGKKSIESVDKNREIINGANKLWDEGKAIIFCILNKEDNGLMGEFALHTINWRDRCCELGYWLLSAYEGQGYVSESIQRGEKVLFEIGFNRLEIRCDPQNVRSFKVAERNEYLLEGILKKNKIVENERIRDTKVYAKLHPSLR